MKIIRNETISYEEAIKLIQDDQSVSILEMHKGFLCKGDYPFRPPEHYGTTIIWPPADIHPAAKLGENIMIGRYTNICGDIQIGDYTRIHGFCFIPDSVKIGKYVFIGANVVFCNIKVPTVKNNQMKIRDGFTIVEDEVSIGAGALIGPGVKIGERSLIGMGAIVTEDVPPDSIVVGCPAKIIKGEING